ncbi:MAG: HD-GYP domain-containing protein [Halobacteriovoraceae bacterium]|nr:HD-GYP domain-containing protein [Halobacteriovoraceae bacterium]
MAENAKKNNKNQVKKSNIISLEKKNISKLKKEVEDLKKLHKETCEMAARSILHALDLKDHYTFGHSTRVAFFSLALGKEMGLGEQELYDLEMASLFHDIGKIGIPDSILLKSVRLNYEEFKVMSTHPEKSAEILKEFKGFEMIAKCAKHHHERFDGKGYPDGLKGEDIPLFSRIILISDTFDAMTSTRTYRKGLGYDVAFKELQDFAGSQFDPKLVELFIKAISKDRDKDSTGMFNLTIIKGDFIKNAA